MLATLRRIADLLDRSRRTTSATDRRLAELIDLLWLTDELRTGKPTPVDEARAVTYYLDQLARSVLPELLDDLDAQLRRVGIVPPPDLRPIRLGTWVGGDRDGNPNVSSTVTMDALRLYADRALALPDRGRRRAHRGALGLDPDRRRSPASSTRSLADRPGGAAATSTTASSGSTRRSRTG